jgi:hypothetical protein
MRALRDIILSALFAASVASPWLCGAEEIDRLIASVNGKVVTEMDLDFSRRLNSLLAFGKDTGSRERQQEIGRLIDLELIRQELQNFPMSREDESTITKGMDDLRKGYEKVPGGLEAVSSQFRLSEEEIRAYLRLQSSIMRFVSFRFTPFVSVPQPEKEKYYREVLVPQLERAHASVPPLSQVEDRIESILRQEKANDALEQWIGELHGHARIEYFSKTDAPEESK